MTRAAACLTIAIVLAGWQGAFAQQPAKRVLIIGIDGCRTDALQTAKAPHLHQLVRDGAMAVNTTILGDRVTGADTVSGPCWSNLLTGVWPDKHGVKDNKFQGGNYKQYPHFFQRLKEVRPNAVTISLTNWAPMGDYIVSGADVSLVLGDTRQEKPDYAAADALVAAEAARLLKEKDPDAMFVYFGNVDETGHKVGFHPSVAPYMQALEQVDQHVGTLLEAMKTRRAIPRRTG